MAVVDNGRQVEGLAEFADFVEFLLLVIARSELRFGTLSWTERHSGLRRSVIHCVDGWLLIGLI